MRPRAACDPSLGCRSVPHDHTASPHLQRWRLEMFFSNFDRLRAGFVDAPSIRFESHSAASFCRSDNSRARCACPPSIPCALAPRLRRPSDPEADRTLQRAAFGSSSCRHRSLPCSRRTMPSSMRNPSESQWLNYQVLARHAPGDVLRARLYRPPILPDSGPVAGPKCCAASLEVAFRARIELANSLARRVEPLYTIDNADTGRGELDSCMPVTTTSERPRVLLATDRSTSRSPTEPPARPQPRRRLVPPRRSSTVYSDRPLLQERIWRRFS